MSDINTILGIVGILPVGAWSAGTAYEYLNAVTNNGSSYLALQDVPAGTALSNTSYWMLIAEKGDTIQSVDKTGTSGLVDTYTITLSSGATFTFTVTNGEKGDTGATGATGPTGNGIQSIYKTGTSGLVDTYTILYTNGQTTEFTVTNGSGQPSDATPLMDGTAAAGTDPKLSRADHVHPSDTTKANVDGYYEQMTVGNAEQLVSTVFIEDKTPYIFRTSGGSADIGDREYDEIVGGTVAWNQLIQNGNFADTSSWSSSGATLTAVDNTLKIESSVVTNVIQDITSAIVAGHKYLLLVGVKSTTSQITVGIYKDNSSWSYHLGAWFPVSSSQWADRGWMFTESGTLGSLYQFRVRINEAVTMEAYLRNVQVFDLTQMFGSAIADYIYTIEQNTPGAGVAWFRKLFPKDYYAYNAGQLMSVNASAHKMVGFNAYDHANTSAKVVGGNQYQITGTYTSISLDGTAITPDSDGYFTPSVSGTLSVVGGNATDTCIHLVWDGERDGEYEPYEVHTYPLDSSLTL